MPHTELLLVVQRVQLPTAHVIAAAHSDDSQLQSCVARELQLGAKAASEAPLAVPATQLARGAHHPHDDKAAQLAQSPTPAHPLKHWLLTSPYPYSHVRHAPVTEWHAAQCDTRHGGVVGATVVGTWKTKVKQSSERKEEQRKKEKEKQIRRRKQTNTFFAYGKHAGPARQQVARATLGTLRRTGTRLAVGAAGAHTRGRRGA